MHEPDTQPSDPFHRVSEQDRYQQGVEWRKKKKKGDKKQENNPTWTAHTPVPSLVPNPTPTHNCHIYVNMKLTHVLLPCPSLWTLVKVFKSPWLKCGLLINFTTPHCIAPNRWWPWFCKVLKAQHIIQDAYEGSREGRKCSMLIPLKALTSMGKKKVLRNSIGLLMLQQFHLAMAINVSVKS